MHLQERINVFLQDNTPAGVYSGQISHYYAKYLQFLGIRDTVRIDGTVPLTHICQPNLRIDSKRVLSD